MTGTPASTRTPAAASAFATPNLGLQGKQDFPPFFCFVLFCFCFCFVSFGLVWFCMCVVLFVVFFIRDFQFLVGSYLFQKKNQFGTIHEVLYNCVCLCVWTFQELPSRR